MATRITVRRDTLANFLSAGTIPANGEPIGITDSTGKVTTYKIGDGVSKVDQLAALSKGDTGTAGPQGLPGTNGVATDNAVATNVATSGTQTQVAFDNRYTRRADQTLNARADFGAKGDGSTDDTAALQSFITAIANGGLRGYIPAGRYMISDQMHVPRVPGWEIIGAGRYSTQIIQKTANTPILELGATNNSNMHSWGIDGITFDYQNPQPATNTNAVCLLFGDKNQGANQGYITNCTFGGGVWGIQTASGSASPWGTTWNNLTFGGSLSGGAIDMLNGLLGVPANVFGRMYADASNMTASYAFRLSGDSQTIESIEVNNLNQGNGLLLLTAASDTTIGSIRVENGNFSHNQSLVALQHLASANIGAIKMGGNSFPIAANTTITLLQVDDGYANIRLAQISTPEPTTNGLLRVAKTTGTGSIEIGMLYLATAAARLVDNGSTDSQVLVKQMNNGRVSGNVGDANYTVVQGGPNTIVFTTPFTATRTITLPSVNDNLFSGLYYEFKFDGAVNGSNTATIQANSTVRVQATDKVIVGFTYRRHAFDPSAGWVLTKYQTLP